MKHVLITGVSTGIGYETARQLTARGYHVFGSARRQEDADRVRAALGPNFTALLFDVTDAEAVKRAAAEVEAAVSDEGLTALVNNAGIAVAGPLELLPVDEVRRQFEVNLFGQLAVIQAFLPMLKATSPPGRIVNVGSTSGRIAYPFMGAYAASKHALEAVSDALRRELTQSGVDVVVIEAGIVRTPILDKAAETDLSQYDETEYGEPLKKALDRFVGNRGIAMARVTGCIREAIESKRPRTRYILVANYLSGWLLPRYLPDRLLDRFVAMWMRASTRGTRSR